MPRRSRTTRTSSFRPGTLMLPAVCARRAESVWESIFITAECDVWHPEIPSKPAKRQIAGAHNLPFRGFTWDLRVPNIAFGGDENRFPNAFSAPGTNGWQHQGAWPEGRSTSGSRPPRHSAYLRQERG